MDKPKKIIIPVIMVWTTFIFNIIVVFFGENKKEVSGRECKYESDSQCSTRKIAEFLVFFFYQYLF